MKKAYYTAEELKKLFESPIWKAFHENNVKKYFPGTNLSYNSRKRLHVLFSTCPPIKSLSVFQALFFLNIFKKQSIYSKTT